MRFMTWGEISMLIAIPRLEKNFMSKTLWEKFREKNYKNPEAFETNHLEYCDVTLEFGDVNPGEKNRRDC